MASEPYEIVGKFNVAEILRSMQQIADKAKATGTSVKEMIKNDAEAKAVVKGFTQIYGAMEKTHTMSKTTGGSLTSMNMAIGQLGYGLGDAGVMAMSFRAGIMGISNNIPIMIQYFQEASKEAKSLGTTFTQQLITSLKGGGGLILGINALMLGMQLLPGLFENTTEKAKEQKDEIKSLAKGYENLAVVQMEYERRKIEAQIKVLEAENKSLEVNRYTRRLKNDEFDLDTGSKIGSKDQAATDRNIEKIKELKNQLIALGDVSAITSSKLLTIMSGRWDVSSLNKISEAIKILRKEYEAAGSESERKRLGGMIQELELLSKKKDILDKDKKVILTKEKVKEEEDKQSDGFNSERKKHIEESNNKALNEELEKELRLKRTIEIEDERRAQHIQDSMDPLLNGIRQTEEYEKRQAELGRTLYTVFETAGDMISGVLIGMIIQGRKANEVFKDLTRNIGMMIIQMGIRGLVSGLFGMLIPGGGGFLGGFKKSLGFAEGGVITEPVVGMGLKSKRSYTIGERGAELITPLNKLNSLRTVPQTVDIRVSGELTGNGSSLHALIKRMNKLENQYR